MNPCPEGKRSKLVHILGSLEPMALVFALLACAMPLGVILGVTGLLDAGTFLKSVALLVVFLAVSAWVRSLFSGHHVPRSNEKTVHDLAPETIIASIKRSNEQEPDYLEQLARRLGRGEHLQNSQDYTQYLMNKAYLVRGNDKPLCQTSL